MKFKQRSSCASYLMGKKGLGLTGQHYIEHWVKEKLFDRKKSFSNKFVEKGTDTETEQSLIDFVAEKLGYGMLVKNKEHFENEWFTGTPDVITSDKIIDVKCSWDPFTFPLYATEIPNIGYVYQAQAYMELVNRDQYELIYGLVDTPDRLIRNQALYLSKIAGYEEMNDEIYQECLSDMTYGDIPDIYRIKKFDIERDESLLADMHDRVLDARSYVKKLETIEFKPLNKL